MSTPIPTTSLATTRPLTQRHYFAQPRTGRTVSTQPAGQWWRGLLPGSGGAVVLAPPTQHPAPDPSSQTYAADRSKMTYGRQF